MKFTALFSLLSLVFIVAAAPMASEAGKREVGEPVEVQKRYDCDDCVTGRCVGFQLQILELQRVLTTP